MYPDNTEDVKTEQNVNTEQYYMGEEDTQKNITNVSVARH